MSDIGGRARSGILAMVCLICAPVAGTALAQAQPRITARVGDTITLSVGSQGGVKAEMTGSVIQVVTAGGAAQRLPIARFTVEGVDDALCRARLIQIGEGFEASVVPGWRSSSISRC